MIWFCIDGFLVFCTIIAISSGMAAGNYDRHTGDK
jgi:hypothetical protein